MSKDSQFPGSQDKKEYATILMTAFYLRSDIFYYLCMHAFLCGYVHMYAQRPQASPRAGVTGSWEQLNTGAGKQSQVFWKNSQLPYPRLLSSPKPLFYKSEFWMVQYSE